MDMCRVAELKCKTARDMVPLQTGSSKSSACERKALLPQDIHVDKRDTVHSSKESNLNFGIETILQNQKTVKETKSEDVSDADTSCHERTPSSIYANLCKLNSDFMAGWYGHVLSRFPRTVPSTTSSGAYPEFNWQLPDTQKDRFSMTRRIGHPYQNRSPPKRKKPRTSFTRVTVMELEKRFERQKYLASSERTTLARSLKISDSQVKTWFQNRRTKWRRQAAEEKELERQSTNRLLLSMTTFPPKQILSNNVISTQK